MSNTRYTFAELANAQAVGVFDSGKTVTIEVINAATDIAEVLTTNVCTPYTDDPETYYWNFSNLDEFPAEFTQFLYIMTDNSPIPVSRREMVDVGGWVSAIAEGLPAADMCKITINVYEADGESVLEPTDLFDPLKKNYAELKSKYFANSRYFKIGKYKPSYDQLSDGFVYFVMPQGATIDIKMESIGIDETNITVPAQSTISLYDLLNP